MYTLIKPHEIWCFFMDSMILNDILFVLRIMVVLSIFPLFWLVITLMVLKDF